MSHSTGITRKGKSPGMRPTRLDLASVPLQILLETHNGKYLQTRSSSDQIPPGGAASQLPGAARRQ